jgi:acyl-CoA reductase-like NAD-dependent aldehyde dehydrogenase
MADRVLQNFVNGKFTDASDGRTSDVIDPSTGEVYAQAPISSRQDVDAAMQAAANAFEGWRDSTPSERSLALLKFADAVEKRAGEVIEAETRNTGKPVALTASEEIPPRWTRSGSSPAPHESSKASARVSTCGITPR